MNDFEDLASDIMEAIRPILNGHSRVNVIKAMAAAFWTMLLVVEMKPEERGKLVRDFVNTMDPAMLAAVKAHNDARGDARVRDEADRALYTAFGIEWRR